MDNAVRSPCVANCKLDEDEVCLGCYRTIEEILTWSSASDLEKRAILARVAQVKQQKASSNQN